MEELANKLVFVQTFLFLVRFLFLLLSSPIGGLHVTQVSLIITQVKNKIAYHLINWGKKLTYRRGAINKQRVKVSGMCDIPNLSYLAKGIIENYSG